MAYQLVTSVSLGVSQTGLTLTAQLVDTSGANVGGVISSGFTEIGDGNYLWNYASFSDGFRGGIKFLDGATLKAFVAVNPEEALAVVPTDVSSDSDARSSYIKMFRAIFDRFFDEVTQDSTNQRVKNDSGTVIATMGVSFDGTTQVKGKSA